MAAQPKKNTDSTDVVITHDQEGWHGTHFHADSDDVSVSFQNKTKSACRITFHKKDDEKWTFGTPFIGLAPQGVISLNILVRNYSTPYTVTDLDQSGDAITGSGETIIIDS